MFETDSTDFRAISNDIKCHSPGPIPNGAVPCRASPMAVAAAVRPRWG